MSARLSQGGGEGMKNPVKKRILPILKKKSKSNSAPF